MRVALYARVSTDEQAKHGQSIDAQLYNLREWAKKNGHTVVGEYVDAGISGKKPPSKRPALSRFFSDLDNGVTVDALAFTKLDRFFRSVKLYYQAVDVLDRHKVAWQAIHEDYETITAGGRMKVNIMLSVAENEADRTAERINAVFERKRAKGECVNPNGLPLGYSYDKATKKVTPNEHADTVRAAFEHYDRTGSVRNTVSFLWSRGVSLCYKSVGTLLHNRLYVGEYRGNLDYCEPIIDRDLFERVQIGLKSRSIRHNPSSRVYLFSGLMICGVCGRRMVGVYHNNRGDTETYNGYRCNRAYQWNVCANHHYISERKVEAFLFEHISEQWEAMTAAAAPPQKEKPVDRAAIMAKLDRLKDIYLDGLIDKAQYIADRDRISAPLAAAPPPARNAAAIQELRRDDFSTHYAALSREEKREFWRALLDRIEIDAQGDVRFYFA